jgi:hypothetical protein
VLEDLADIVAEAHSAGADLVHRSASEVEEEKDRGWEGSSDLAGQNNREEVVRKACPEILDPVQTPLVVGHSDHIEDSSSEIGAEVDVVGVVGNSEVQTVVDCDVAVLEVMAGSVETRSMCIWVRRHAIHREQVVMCAKDFLIRRKATENIHMVLRFRNRSVIYIRNISS